MKKVFHAPALPDVKPPRVAMPGRPRGTIPTGRVHDPRTAPYALCLEETCRMFEDHFDRFFCAKRPWMERT